MEGWPTSGDTSGRDGGGAVPYQEWWVDDDGNWRGGGYLSLLCPPDHQDARHDGECGALFYLGMANVVMSPHRIRVRWSVQDVHPNTLRSINDLLESLEAPPRIVLEYYFGGWERRYFSSVALAVQCLKSAMRFRDTEPMIKPFVRRMPLNHENALPMFRKFLERWELGGGRFSTTRETTLSPVNERLLALTPRGGDDRLIYSHLGAQAALTRFKGPQWAHEVTGSHSAAASFTTPTATS